MVYTNVGSEYDGDSITLSLTDGIATVTKTMEIVVGLVDDETPRLSINRGLRVHAGKSSDILLCLICFMRINFIIQSTLMYYCRTVYVRPRFIIISLCSPNRGQSCLRVKSKYLCVPFPL